MTNPTPQPPPTPHTYIHLPCATLLPANDDPLNPLHEILTTRPWRIQSNLILVDLLIFPSFRRGFFFREQWCCQAVGGLHSAGVDASSNSGNFRNQQTNDQSREGESWSHSGFQAWILKIFLIQKARSLNNWKWNGLAYLKWLLKLCPCLSANHRWTAMKRRSKRRTFPKPIKFSRTKFSDPDSSESCTAEFTEHPDTQSLSRYGFLTPKV